MSIIIQIILVLLSSLILLILLFYFSPILIYRSFFKSSYKQFRGCMYIVLFLFCLLDCYSFYSLLNKINIVLNIFIHLISLGGLFFVFYVLRRSINRLKDSYEEEKWFIDHKTYNSWWFLKEYQKRSYEAVVNKIKREAFEVEKDNLTPSQLKILDSFDLEFRDDLIKDKLSFINYDDILRNRVNKDKTVSQLFFCNIRDSFNFLVDKVWYYTEEIDDLENYKIDSIRKLVKENILLSWDNLEIGGKEERVNEYCLILNDILNNNMIEEIKNKLPRGRAPKY